MIRSLWGLENILFPRRCPVCGEIVVPEGELICRACIPKLSAVREPICRKCGKEVLAEHEEYCMDCMRHRRTFESGAALLNYNKAAQKSMAAIKYKNRREYLDFYSSAMEYRFGERVRFWKAEALIPVPVHPSRLRKRGFNQAEELADRLGRGWKLPVDKGLLIRTKKTVPQRDLNPAERLKNLQEAFQVSRDRRGGQDRIWKCAVLVDDIYTTGSTMEACARVLKEAGVREVHFLAVCIGNGR